MPKPKKYCPFCGMKIDKLEALESHMNKCGEGFYSLNDLTKDEMRRLSGSIRSLLTHLPDSYYVSNAEESQEDMQTQLHLYNTMLAAFACDPTHAGEFAVDAIHTKLSNISLTKTGNVVRVNIGLQGWFYNLNESFIEHSDFKHIVPAVILFSSYIISNLVSNAREPNMQPEQSTIHLDQDFKAVVTSRAAVWRLSCAMTPEYDLVVRRESGLDCRARHFELVSAFLLNSKRKLDKNDGMVENSTKKEDIIHFDFDNDGQPIFDLPNGAELLSYVYHTVIDIYEDNP